METALLPAEPTQNPQGSSARIFRRLGGAVRGAISGGVALAARRPEAVKPNRAPPQPRDPAAPPAPRRSRLPRAAVPAPTAERRGWFARWFGSRRSRPAGLADPAMPPGRGRRRASKDPLFTPKTHPGLSPEACAFFNTPVGECDPEMLQQVLALLAEQIAGAIGPGLGMDAEALFSHICGRLGVTPGAAGADAPSAPPPEATEPAADAAAAEPPAPTPADTPAGTALGAPPNSPQQAQGIEPADDAAVAAAEGSTTNAIFLAGADLRRHPSLAGDSRPFAHRRRHLVARRRLRSNRGLPGGFRSTLPPRRLFYAACAGPS